MDIPQKLLKPYEPREAEAKIYEKWGKSGFFNPDNLPGERKESFSIVLPPPNVTGILHMGSALTLVIEDVMVRFARMNGKAALWIPGTDSAAIATQAKVEKEIQKKEGKNKYELGREELLRRIEVSIEENKSTILDQVRKMGASVDWSRYAYTMDEKRSRAVTTAFVRMHEAGLIYRGNRIVNWDPKGQTTISDDEIIYEERAGKLYTFKYSEDFPIAISTTRPETKVGDTAVAVHPDDPRYKEFIGEEYNVTFCDVPLHIKVVADPSVLKDFGTGALGVTPAHSQIDWEIADRHNLPRPHVINELGKMTVNGRLEGKKTGEAREIIIAWLKEKNLLEKEENITQNISTAERTGGTIEPLPKLQWFIDVEKSFTIPHSKIPGIPSGSHTTLKEIMRKSVESGEIKILSEQFEKTYFHWINNLRPWCISRQIWFGHRIPVWYRSTDVHDKSGSASSGSREIETYVGMKSPGGDGWTEDPDVLDTWFSSALWTFSTLGWPDDTKDLKRFHPTSVIESGYDILFFWIARMILMSGFFLGEVPFKTVYLHGLVRDEQGRKISKSLGNNIDPIEMGKKYGTDALRMSLVIGMAPGTDSKISESKIRGYKNFVNKIWNIARFVLENNKEVLVSEHTVLVSSDAIIYAEFKNMGKEVTEHMRDYQFHLAGEKLYHYLWHAFADKIIEESKPIFQSGSPEDQNSRRLLLIQILEDSLKLLHPFMPFITEELWELMPRGTILPKTEESLLISQSWPM